MQKSNVPVRNLTYVALFVALIAALTQVSIPMPFGVPMTLQTFVIPLAGVILGAKYGVMAVVVYILIGIIGLPVFSGGGSGIGWLFGPTGGFLIGFPFYALCAGFATKAKSPLLFAFWLFLGMSITYTIGMLQFAWVTERTVAEAFLLVVLQFMPTELIKLAFVWMFGRKMRKVLEAAGYLL